MLDLIQNQIDSIKEKLGIGDERSDSEAHDQEEEKKVDKR